MTTMHAPHRGIPGAGSIFVLLAALVAGCASVPYQEMSDARQAIDAARPIVAEEPGPRAQVEEARTLLQKAEEHLHAGQYGAARRMANEAKELAIDAREEAEQGQ